jgi:hypothetical protein
VAEEPEEREVGVDLAVHHSREVELDVGLAGEALVVAEDAEAEAVREEAPEVALVPVQELLYEAVGAGPRCARDALGGPVEVDVAAQEVDGGVLPDVGDGVGLAFDLEALAGGQATVAQFLEEG